MTNRLEILDRSVMMSSVIPSLKYSCSGSLLILVKGKTAIEGLSGAGKAGASAADSVSEGEDSWGEKVLKTSTLVPTTSTTTMASAAIGQPA